MITLKLSAYSTKEKVALQQLFAKMGSKLTLEYCNAYNVPCDQCEHRHICNDIFATEKHLRDQIRNEIEVQTV